MCASRGNIHGVVFNIESCIIEVFSKFVSLWQQVMHIGEVSLAIVMNLYPDPTRPVGSWRIAWRALTKKAGLQGLRFHDLRHTAISALGEAGVPDRVIMDIAGHVSPRMLRRYSHIQLEAKRTAIQALSNRPKATESENANVTKHVTKQGEGVVTLPQVIEKDGRPERARTVDLHRVKVAL
jgi:site-specific recombinase XerD